MSTNLNRLPDQQDELYRQEEAQPRFQEYQEFDETQPRLQELVFFAKIAFFCVATVLSAFVFLALKLSPVLAFPLAMLLSFGVTTATKHFIVAKAPKL